MCHPYAYARPERRRGARPAAPSKHSPPNLTVKFQGLLVPGRSLALGGVVISYANDCITVTARGRHMDVLPADSLRAAASFSEVPGLHPLGPDHVLNFEGIGVLWRRKALLLAAPGRFIALIGPAPSGRLAIAIVKAVVDLPVSLLTEESVPHA